MAEAGGTVTPDKYTQPLRVISYGGGVQSTALVILAAQGKLDTIMGGTPTHALFANVGDDSEHPATIAYVRETMLPWAGERGVAVTELHRTRRDGSTETLMDRLTKPGSRSLPIPLRTPITGKPGSRSCTADFKVRVIGKWLKEHGASPAQPASVAIGISLDEWHRIHNRRANDYEKTLYPLLDLELDRAACQQVIRDAGLPVPPKSACYFCPFHRTAYWQELRRDRPDLFTKAAELEALLIARREELGRYPMFLTRFGKPITEAIHEAQDTLPWEGVGGEGCDDGYCFT